MGFVERLPLYATNAIGAFIVYYASVAIYRVFFHPLAHIPGPWFAGASSLVEFYYEILRDGQYTFKIKEWHEEYGPLLRIGPHQVHCNDPAFVDQIYASSASGKKRDKAPRFCRALGAYTSGASTLDHDLHRRRRAALNKYFSTLSIRKIESFIKEKIDAISHHLDTYYGSPEAIQEGRLANLSDAMSCITTDVISEFTFGYSYNQCDSSTFLPNIRTAIEGSIGLNQLCVFFPWIRFVLDKIPLSINLYLNPEFKALLEYLAELAKNVDKVREETSLGEARKSRMGATIFTELLQSDLPESEKTRQRFLDEAFILIGAGTDTVASSCSLGMYYLLTQPETLQALLVELEQAIPDPRKIPESSELEQLPYLGCVIQETLRLYYGVVTRLERIPHESLVYSGVFKDKSVEHFIPARTIIGMSSAILHHNEAVYPESDRFLPERWLDENGQRRKDLDAKLLTFSKGSRQCLGITLAYAEMYIIFGTLIRRFGRRMQLVDTAKSEVVLERDYFLPKKQTSHGIRVRISPK